VSVKDILSTVFGAATSGGTSLVGEIVGLVRDRFPAKMTPQEEAALQAAIEDRVDRRIAEGNRHAEAIEAQFNDRVREHEGTAKDLQALPMIGPVLLTLRGVQRPAWGFAALYFDWLWFGGEFAQMTDQQQATLYAINLLVLGFLFGERAVQNVAPAISQMLGARKP
jgi:hypothetical protein